MNACFDHVSRPISAMHIFLSKSDCTINLIKHVCLQLKNLLRLVYSGIPKRVTPIHIAL